MYSALSVGCVSVPEFRGADASVDAPIGDVPHLTCAQVIDMPGLLAYLPFESINGGIVEDVSANSHDGTVLGGAQLAAGRHGNGIVLDGAKGVNLGSAQALDNLAAMTVCAWVNPTTIDSQNAGATIADKSTDGYVGGWNTYLDYDPQDTGLHVGYLARSGYYGYSGKVVAASRWTHACTVWALGALTVYVDGQVDAIKEMGTTHMPPEHDDAANNLVLGRQTNANQYQLNGVLDEFVLYNRALTAAEIAAIFACKP
jgi:hypothetical protein